MYELIELPSNLNGYIAKFKNIETQEIIEIHRREYRGNIQLNQTVNLNNIKK